MGHAQNVSDGFTKPVAPISHTPTRFVTPIWSVPRRCLARRYTQGCFSITEWYHIPVIWIPAIHAGMTAFWV